MELETPWKSDHGDGYDLGRCFLVALGHFLHLPLPLLASFEAEILNGMSDVNECSVCKWNIIDKIFICVCMFFFFFFFHFMNYLKDWTIDEIEQI